MKMTKKAETEDTIDFTYDKPSGLSVVEGYRYYADGKLVSRTFDEDDLEVRFGKVPSGKYGVEAIGFQSIAQAQWPEVVIPSDPSSARKVAQAIYEGFADVNDVPLWKAHGTQAKADDRMEIVQDPLGQRDKVMQVIVKPGDSQVAGSNQGERADVMCGSSTVPMREGSILAGRMGLMLPTDFRSNSSGWNVFLGAHDRDGGTQSPLQGEIRNDKELRMRILGGQHTDGPGTWTFRRDLGPWLLDKNRWYDFVWVMKFSADPSRGRAALYLNGNKLADQPVANLYAGSYCYHKQGWYRVAQSYATRLFMDSTFFWTADTFEDARDAALA